MRLRKQDGIELLRAVWLFERCSNRELGAAAVATPIDVPAGKVLTAEGDIERVLRHRERQGRSGGGHRDRDGGAVRSSVKWHCSTGGRAATVTTLDPTTVLVITAGEFNSLVMSMPSVDRKMLVVLVERLRDVEARFVPRTRVTNRTSVRQVNESSGARSGLDEAARTSTTRAQRRS
jgi:hypothetical protein